MRKHWNYWDAPLNFWTGCHAVSPGCDNCWARTGHNKRHEARLAGKTGLPNMFDLPFDHVQVFTDKIKKPIPGGRPKTYFVNNTSDTFHHAVPDEIRDELFEAMWRMQTHRYLLLTKRPEVASRYLAWLEMETSFGPTAMPTAWRKDPLNCVWLGVTVEDQKRADKRIPLLLQTPARNRWLSVEPMLGPVDLSGCFENQWRAPEIRPAGVAWVVFGSESGANRRHCSLDWIYSGVDQCQNAGVKVFVKQVMVDGKTIHDWNDKRFPEDLKIRELPWEPLDTKGDE